MKPGWNRKRLKISRSFTSAGKPAMNNVRCAAEEDVRPGVDPSETGLFSLSSLDVGETVLDKGCGSSFGASTNLGAHGGAIYMG